MLYTASWVITTDNHTSFLYDNNLVRGLLFCQVIFAKLNICQLFWFHRTHNNVSKDTSFKPIFTWKLSNLAATEVLLHQLGYMPHIIVLGIQLATFHPLMHCCWLTLAVITVR